MINSNMKFSSISRETPKVSHYIINVSQEKSRINYRIGDKNFTSMKDLLNFYKSRPLDTSTLTRIVKKNIKLKRFSSSFHFRIPNLVSEQNTISMQKFVFVFCFFDLSSLVFTFKDDEDLSFRKGEILMVIKKVEPLWWSARNTRGDQGVIPANYVEIVPF